MSLSETDAARKTVRADRSYQRSGPRVRRRRLIVPALGAILVIAFLLASNNGSALGGRGAALSAVAPPWAPIAGHSSPPGSPGVQVAVQPGGDPTDLQSQTQLAAAEAALRNGAGPAGGNRLGCAPSPTSPATIDCRSGGASSSPRPAALPAAGSSPASNLQWQPIGVPSTREFINYAMTWDYADNYVVLFGGSNVYGIYSGDTWTYKSGAWTELNPLVAPQGRDSSGLAYSGWDNAVALFGGYSPGTGGQLNDTWLFKAGTWTQLHVNGPSPRWGFAFVYDPNATYNPSNHASTTADVLFGGSSWACAGTAGTGGGAGTCSDTWYFWADHWTNQTRAKAPPARVGPSMIYDYQDGHLVLFGGSSATVCLTGNYCGDTWEYNWTAGWVQVGTSVPCGNAATGACAAGKAPSPRDEAAFAYDFTDGYAVLFGGRNVTGDQQTDTWKYLGGVWTHLTPVTFPIGRSGEALAYDFSSGDGYLLLIGGSEGQAVPADLNWQFSFGAWSMVTPSASRGPGATEGGSMVYDAADGYVLYYGGFVPASSTYSTATWKFQGGVWTQLFPGTVPYQSEFASMAYDPTAGYVMLFGGNYYGALSNFTWGFQGGNWFLVCTYPCAFGVYPPSPREGVGMAFDQASGAMILFGGYGGKSVLKYLSETWAFYVTGTHAGYWSNYTTYLGATVPGPRALPGMAWDQADREIVLFGGGNGTSTFQDTWVMSDLYAGWSEVGLCGGPGQSNCPAGTPNRAAGMVFTYDAMTQGVVMSGGTGLAAFYGYIQATTAVFQAGRWYTCTTYECQSYYTGLGTFDAWGAAAYDAADGYTVTAGGESWFYNNAAGFGMYFWMPVSWAFAQEIESGGPGVSPTYIDLGQPASFSIGATGGGIGSYSFTWEGVPQGCTPPSAQSASFSCNVLYPGFKQYYNALVYGSYYEPSATVFDSSGYPSVNTAESGSWLNSLNVAPDPVATINASASAADAGQTIYLGLVGSGGWGPMSFMWSDLPTGCAVANTTASTQLVKCVLAARSIGAWAPDGGLTDGAGFTAWAPALSVIIYPSPSATGIVANTQSLDTGQTLSVGVAASGGTGSFTYDWSGVPSACRLNAALLSCTVPASESGSYVPSVTVRDSNGGLFSETFAGTIVVSPAPAVSNLAVTNASSDPTGSVDAGQSVTFTLTATTGSGGDTIAWSGLPAGCAPAGSDSTVIACSPSGVGSFAVSAQETDSNGAVATSPTAGLDVAPTLTAPGIGASTTALDIGQPLSLAASYAGGSGGETFRWSGLPVGCVAASAPALACTVSGSGSFTPVVTIRDSNGAAVVGTLAGAIVVSDLPSAAALTVRNASSVPTTAVDVGQAVTFALIATVGSGGDAIVWMGLPTGCTPAGSASTQVSCSPTGAGAFSVSAELTDSNGVSVTSPVADLLVSPSFGAASVSASATSVDIGQLLTLGVSFTGGSGTDTVLWSGLPAGCVASGGPSVACTATTPGHFSPGAVVRDSNGATSQSSLTGGLTVYRPPTATGLVISSPGNAAVSSVLSGASVTFTLTSTAGSGGDTVVWSGLPSGCAPTTQNSTAVTCSPGGVGSYSVSARLTDSNGIGATSPTAVLVVTSPPPATPFATNAQWVQIGLLGALLALGAVAVLLALRRPGSGGGGSSGPPHAGGSRPPTRASGGAGAPATSTEAPVPEYIET